MNEKMQEELKRIYEGLTEEQKEKVKECKSVDEIMELAGKWGIEMPEDYIDAVAGGAEEPEYGCEHYGCMCYYNKYGCN